MSSSAVNLYAPCGLSKRSNEPPVSLHDIAGPPQETSAESRAKAWVSSAWSPNLLRRPFEETYLGGFWGQIRKAPPPSAIRVFAVSAGFGILPPGTPIPNYDATFAPRSHNSIGTTSQMNREWWRHLGNYAALHGRPQSISSAMHLFPGIHLLALPQVYLDAVWEDVLVAISDRNISHRIVILTTPYSGDSFVSPRSLIVPSGLRAELGGTIGTILPRLALHLATILNEQSGNLDALRSTVSKMRLENTLSPLRQKLTDGSVRLFIREFLRDHPGTVGYTPALRDLRSKGLACEMKRFRCLFNEIQVPNTHE